MTDKKKSNDKKEKKINKELEKLQEEKNKLEKELSKIKEIATHTQSQYLNLKSDFDSLMNRMEREKKENETKYLFDTLHKFLPFIEQLRKSCENIPENIIDDGWVKGIELSYNDVLKKLAGMGVYPINSIGEEPNHEKHEPIGTLPTEDEKMKGKIIQEFEKGFVYRKGEIETIIKAAKVIVGQ